MATPVYGPVWMHLASDKLASAIIGGEAVTECEHSGFNVSGYVNFPSSGGSVEWTNVDGRDGGEFALTFRYALGWDESRTANLSVNGSSVGSITFNSTGGWAMWKTVRETVTLNPGATNTIRIETTGNDAGNID